MRALRRHWPSAVLLVSALSLTAIVMWAGAPLPGDVGATRWVQSRTWYGDPAAVANQLNGILSWVALAATAAAVALFARLHGNGGGSRSALFILFLAVALRVATPILKEIVGSPRPQPSLGVRVTEMRSSLGFPSGHVYTAVLVYGCVAWALTRTWGRDRGSLRWTTWTAAAGVMATAGPARVYVGAHWPSDVLGGYLWGATALTLAVLVAGRPRHRPPVTPRAAPGRSAPGG